MGPGTAGAAATGTEARFWYLLAYQDDVPVGAACVTEYALDASVFASRFSQWVVSIVRRVFPCYLKFRATFCGLPISTSGSNVRVVDDADRHRVLKALNDAVERIAGERRSWLVIYKELDAHQAAEFDALSLPGYVKAESLPMNRLVNRFGSLTNLLNAMRSHYRYKIMKSQAKLVANGLTVARISDPDAIRAQYTPELHRLYEHVVGRAKERLEILPREFFLELADRFRERLTLTTISDDERVVGLSWSLFHGTIYRNLFVGVDYERNDHGDVYFNLMIEGIAQGLQSPAEEIYVGQTADDFKSRLGCTPMPRYLFIKATNGFLRWCLLLFKSSILTSPPPVPPRNVFKDARSDSNVESAPSDACAHQSA